jgi:hypothetical protein
VKLSLSGLEPGTGERTNIGECERFEPAQIHIVASHSTRVDLVDAASSKATRASRASGRSIEPKLQSTKSTSVSSADGSER